MSMVAISKTTFDSGLQSTLLELHDIRHRQYDIAFYNRRFREAILDFGSETPDNLQCAERVCLGLVNGQWGIRLVEQALLFSDIALQLVDNERLMNEIKAVLPDLQMADWRAAVSFTYLLMKDLEAPFGLAHRLKEVFVNAENGRLSPRILQHIQRQANHILEKNSPCFPSIDFEGIQRRIEFAAWQNEGIFRSGVRVKDYVFLSDIFNVLEETAAPAFLSEQQNWEAFNRLMTLLFLSFESNKARY